MLVCSTPLDLCEYILQLYMIHDEGIGFVFFYQDVIRSMIGTAIWIAIITTWVVLFQTNRVAWGITADKISFLIPKGIP